MVKLGKKKVVEELSRKKSETEGRRRNGAAPGRDSDDKSVVSEEQAERGDAASRASNSSSEAKKATKRKSKSTVRYESIDSDDLPLNGNVASGAKKSRKSAKAKGTPAKNGTKAASKRQSAGNDAADNDQENSDAEAGSPEDEQEEYEVEAIVGHKTMRGASYFLVRWKGYNKDFDTWELEGKLNCDDLIAQFRNKPKVDTVAKAKGRPKVVKKTATGRRGRPSGGAAKKTATPADPEKEWTVERIVDCVEDDDGSNIYRIRWKGFGPKDDTWEPEANLFCEGLIEKYKRELITQKNVDTKELRESPKKTKRLVNECYPRTNIHNRIERSSKRCAAKNRVFYGEE
ncbi:heterochromatin protein 1 isoform X2 [Drosophila serrata]|uniref:heterochromatin protein 1 isoform X2 n=1 Tax=Drosophila serrata TaxID=7274 RepID=UPI000A1D3804|nr:heterochromatin protein 1 isoform X2 [Drosophila serrata]